MSKISTMLPAEKFAIGRWTKGAFVLVFWLGVIVWWLGVFESAEGFFSPSTGAEVLKGLLGLAFLLSLSFLLMPCVTFFLNDWIVRLAHHTGQASVTNPPGMFTSAVGLVGYLFVAGVSGNYWSILLVKWLFGGEGILRAGSTILFACLNVWFLYLMFRAIAKSMRAMINREDTARKYYKEGRFAEALSLCHDLVRDRLGTKELFFLRARIFLIQGMAEEAEADLLFLQKEDRDHGEKWGQWASRARTLRLGQKGKTIEYVGTCVNVGWFELEEGSTFGAIHWFTRALEVDGQRADACLGRAFAFSRLKKFPDALRDSDLGVELMPQQGDYWSGRGVVRIRAGLFDEAQRDLDEAIRLNPTKAGTYVRDNMRVLAEFLRENGDSFAALHLRGFCHLKLGQLNEAVADFSACIRLQPSESQLYVDRGWVKWLAGDHQLAKEDFRKAIELRPEWENHITQEINRLTRDLPASGQGHG